MRPPDQISRVLRAWAASTGGYDLTLADDLREAADAIDKLAEVLRLIADLPDGGGSPDAPITVDVRLIARRALEASS